MSGHKDRGICSIRVWVRTSCHSEADVITIPFYKRYFSQEETLDFQDSDKKRIQIPHFFRSQVIEVGFLKCLFLISSLSFWVGNNVPPTFSKEAAFMSLRLVIPRPQILFFAVLSPFHKGFPSLQMYQPIRIFFQLC